MTDAEQDDPDDAAVAPDRGRRLTLTFEAFRATHHKEWLRYARLQTGSPAEARRVVDEACAHLAADWPHVLKQPSVGAYAWDVLKEHIGRRPPAAKSRPGDLYVTVSRLPERQYDVMVLRYALGYEDERVARLLGVKENTVRSLVRLAKRRLTAGAAGD
jgi:DNA-directed RNA polymerase specialized sigma24 family protein